eukprot:6008138-Pyramimonas_sp.AAC.1
MSLSILAGRSRPALIKLLASSSSMASKSRARPTSPSEPTHDDAAVDGTAVEASTPVSFIA